MRLPSISTQDFHPRPAYDAAMDECPNAIVTLTSHTTAAHLFRTSSQLALDPWNSRAGRAVPTYELPSLDLMDYDMTYMIAVRGDLNGTKAGKIEMGTT